MMSSAPQALAVRAAPPPANPISKPRAMYSIDEILGNQNHNCRNNNVIINNNNIGKFRPHRLRLSSF